MDDEVDSDEDVYEVEKIVDNIVVGGKTYYRVRWKNYSEDGDTWEPRENLLSCEDLLNNYIRTQSEKTSGLHLPSDVFTPGTGESSSETAHDEAKQTRIESKKNRRLAQDKKVKKGKTKKAQTKACKISSSESSSEEEPQVKDPFWENLKQGKIDVFASDLYSKVKQRRFPESDSQDGPVKATKKTAKKKPEEEATDAPTQSDPAEKKSGEVEEKTEQPEEIPKRMTRQTEAEEAAKEKSVEISSDSDNDPPLQTTKDTGKNAVLEYLQSEIQSKKDKKSRKNKDKQEKLKKPETKLTQAGEDASRKSFISSLFEESEANLPAEKKDLTKSGEDDEKTKTAQLEDISKTISKPNIVLEKIDIPSKDKEKTDSVRVKKEKAKEESKKKGEKERNEEAKGTSNVQIEKVRRAEAQKRSPHRREDLQRAESPRRTLREQTREGRKEQERNKKSRKIRERAEKDSDRNEMQKEENREQKTKKDLMYSTDKDSKTTDVSSTDDESKKPELRSKHIRDNSKEKPINPFEPTDAFSAQLQESDVAVSDWMLKKKEKTKKLKSGPKNIAERPSTSPTMISTSTSGASVLELLTQEMERTANLGAANSDPKLTPFDAAVKDAHNRLGLKAPPPISSSDKAQPLPCAPDMVEFLKIKVNFELDEISVKDIERHHEMGEPPCRLERDVTNAEFRQYIRANNFEMVHEALKSKKMMYNLEHTDSLWMTQLMVAAAAGFDEIVKVLAHHGARVNARSKIGQTALMFAAEKGHDIVCRILIAYGAYINLQTTSGETALMKAAKNGHAMIARYLLQAGADPTLKSVHGTTAREMAERASQTSLSEVVRVHETNINAYVNECIHRECHILGFKTIGLPILATRVFNIRETALVHVTFNCVIQNLPPNQGVLLFALHGMIGSGLSIKCRMRGPCYINAVTLNNFLMDPVMPGKQAPEGDNYFITNLVWRAGQNSLRLFMSQDQLSNEKLFITIFTCGFVD